MTRKFTSDSVCVDIYEVKDKDIIPSSKITEISDTLSETVEEELTSGTGSLMNKV